MHPNFRNALIMQTNRTRVQTHGVSTSEAAPKCSLEKTSLLSWHRLCLEREWKRVPPSHWMLVNAATFFFVRETTLHGIWE